MKMGGNIKAKQKGGINQPRTTSYKAAIQKRRWHDKTVCARQLHKACPLSIPYIEIKQAQNKPKMGSNKKKNLVLHCTR